MGCMVVADRSNATPHTMNNSISTLIRHALTYLAGIGGYLHHHGLIDATGVDAANQAGAQLVDPLSIIAGLLAVVAARVALGLLGKIFPSIAEKASGGVSGGAFLLVACGTAAALMGALPSCSHNGYPVTGSLSYLDAASGAQVGLNIGPPQAPAKVKRVKRATPPPTVDAASNK